MTALALLAIALALAAGYGLGRLQRSPAPELPPPQRPGFAPGDLLRALAAGTYAEVELLAEIAEATLIIEARLHRIRRALEEIRPARRR